MKQTFRNIKTVYKYGKEYKSCLIYETIGSLFGIFIGIALPILLANQLVYLTDNNWIQLIVMSLVVLILGLINALKTVLIRKNTQKFTVGVTENPAYSRMTVAASGDNASLVQISKQLNKLEDVVEIVELEPGKSVCRELVLVKVKTEKDSRQDIISIADIFRANIVDVSKGSLIIELIGTTSKCEAFLKLLDGFEIVELVRTGLTGLVRG